MTLAFGMVSPGSMRVIGWLLGGGGIKVIRYLVSDLVRKMMLWLCANQSVELRLVDLQCIASANELRLMNTFKQQFRKKRIFHHFVSLNVSFILK